MLTRTIKRIPRQRTQRPGGTARQELAHEGGRRRVVRAKQHLDGFVQTQSQRRVGRFAQPGRIDALPQSGHALFARHFSDRAKHAQRAVLGTDLDAGSEWV